MQDVGIDLGFYQVKLSTDTENIKYPSVIGYPSAVELQNNTPVGKAEENIMIGLDDQSYYIGEKAIRDTSTSQLTFLSDKTDNITDRLKYLAALGLAMKEKNLGTFKVVTGLPVDEFAGVSSLKERLAENMKGHFSFSLNNRNLKAIVANVTVIPQCAGAYYDFIMEPSGRIDETKVSPKTVIVDIGYRTTDIVTMINARFSPRESFTIFSGVSDVHKEFRKQLVRSYQVTRDIAEIDPLMRRRRLYVNGKDESIDALIHDSVKPYAEKIVSEIPLYILNLKEIHQVIITGGGAALMAPYFQQEIGRHGVNVIVMPDAEFSNSRGYLKYAKFLAANQ